MSAPQLAADLARRWQDLGRRHVAVAFGCACGAPMGHVSLSDLEQDIIAYLRHRHPPETDPILDRLFPAGDPDPDDLNRSASGERRTLLTMLLGIAVLSDDSGQTVMEFLTDLQRSIASCERPIAGRKRVLRAEALP